MKFFPSDLNFFLSLVNTGVIDSPRGPDDCHQPKKHPIRYTKHKDRPEF